jgi:HPt (histidine-containing phosphotransfer) domain-containing protein
MSDAATIVVHVDIDLEEFIPEFLDNRRSDVQSICAAVGSGDFETIRVLGHSMKGSGAGLGFELITGIGAALEQAAKKQDDAAIRNGLEQLVDYLGKVKVVYEEL